MECRPAAFAQCSHIWICLVQLGVEFSNGDISDVAPAQVQKDVLKIQNNSRVKQCDINTNCVVTDAFQVNLTNGNGTQEGRVDAIDGGNQALLPGEPPDPEPNPIGDRNWRKQDSGEHHDDDHQNNEEDSIFERHRCDRKR